MTWLQRAFWDNSSVIVIAQSQFHNLAKVWFGDLAAQVDFSSAMKNKSRKKVWERSLCICCTGSRGVTSMWAVPIFPNRPLECLAYNTVYVSPFSKFFMPLHFCKRPTAVPRFINWNWKRVCTFRKRTKSEKKHSAFFFFFCSGLVLRKSTPQEARVALPSSFPGNILSICYSFELCLWASVLYLDLFCASLATCVLK